ncbi:GNAT family N-acetyltransferase [Gorillibacterium massiliense]|uniref:GNAT family N-acetyltransferase n=1 Tax=Gorillibacterium massiliense TaxID=1280390 RepID=UPI0004BA9A42|nr:GNAT family N-acetyltransferase [Gorillibacterium massiliense]
MSDYDYFKSERLVYRPFQLDDLQAYVAMCNEGSRRRWFYFQEPACLTEEFWVKEFEQIRAVWSRKVHLLEERAGCGLAVTLKETGDLIGFVALTKFHGPDEELKDVEIGYHIGEAYQGHGYGTEAAKAAVEWGIAHLLQRGAEPKIVGKAEHENVPSRRVLEKAGFRYAHAEQYVSVYELLAT